MYRIIDTTATTSITWTRRLIAKIKASDAQGLSVFFATLCIIDLFGVFPIIALPGALISCGYYGIPLLVFVLSLQVYTAVVLGRCWIIAEKLDPMIIEKKRSPYAAVAELIYGKRMRIFVNCLLNVTVFGAGVPNILVASQNLQLIGFRISDGEFRFSFCNWLIILGIILCPIMWLGSPKNMKGIACVSVVTVVTVSILIWICIMDDDTVSDRPFVGIQLEQPDYVTMLKVYGMIAFQFDIHPMLMTIEVDMQQRRKVGNAVCYGIFVTCILAIITTIMAAYKYGMNTESNVLQILPNSNLLYGAIALVTVQLCLSHAVGSSALFQNCEEYLNIPKHFNWKRCILRSLIVAMAVIIAELVPQFDLVMGIIGGTLTGPLIFILPPLFYRRLIRLEKEHDELVIRSKRDDDDTSHLMITQSYERLKDDGNLLNKNDYGTFIRETGKFVRSQRWLLCFGSESCICIAVIIFGLIATVTSTYFNLLTAATTGDFRSPCIEDIGFSFDEF